jgi:hypothetical protein
MLTPDVRIQYADHLSRVVKIGGEERTRTTMISESSSSGKMAKVRTIESSVGDFR